MKARVYVTLKAGVLDPAGKAVAHGLHQLGFAEVADVRLGKFIEVTLDPSEADPAARLAEMCRELLANPVIEDYRVELSGKE